MILEGLNKIRDLWSALITAIELGTGTDPETADDTDLQTVIAGSESTVITATTANQHLIKEGRLVGTSGGGESVTEIIWKTSSPEKTLSRVTFTPQTWNTSSDIIIQSRWYFRGRRE